jgi:hypothetical protein
LSKGLTERRASWTPNERQLDGSQTAVGASEERNKTMSKHTPEPWVVNGSAIETDYASDNVAIAHIYDTDENGPNEYVANAKLIAAAPDLLEACEAVIKYFGNPNKRTQFDVERDLLTAIARAKGERS